MDVKWGGISLIEAALELLKESTQKCEHRFYHLISGSDFFLKSIDEIDEFFDITDGFARYVLSNEKWIKNNFSFGWCADELFLQSVFLNSKFTDRYENPVREHTYTESIYLDIMRMIDWTRGHPYVWKTDEDFEILTNSGCLMARKFDYERYPEIIDRLEAKITADK